MTSTLPLPHRVLVPGSTSNLGPGFDCLGLALSLFVEARAVARCAGPGHSLERRSGSAMEWPGDDSDLFLRAVDLASGRAPDAPGWEFEVNSQIPIARGLGSSGAAVAAGLLLGASLTGRAVSPRELLVEGLELEGHPDNVAASLIGGLTLCAPLRERPSRIPLLQPVFSASLGVVVAWSEHRTPTERARAVLPDQVAFADAVENPRRLALLLAGLEHGDAELLAAGAVDHLHERWRLPLVPGGSATLAAARRAGAPLATLSGSGSALLAIAPLAQLEEVRAAMKTTLAAHAEGATARILEVVSDNPRVVTGSNEPG